MIYDIHWKCQLVAAADEFSSRPPGLRVGVVSPYRERVVGCAQESGVRQIPYVFEGRPGYSCRMALTAG